MDALCIDRNGIRQLAVELIPSAGVQFSLNWLGNAMDGIAITVSRANELPEYSRWHTLQLLAGDTVSFVTSEADRVDEPLDVYSDEEMVTRARSKPKMSPGTRVRIPSQEVGIIDCQINHKLLFEFRLKTDNMLSVAFVWLGDRKGTCVTYIDSAVSPKPINPKIEFRDAVTFIWR